MKTKDIWNIRYWSLASAWRLLLASFLPKWTIVHIKFIYSLSSGLILFWCKTFFKTVLEKKRRGNGDVFHLSLETDAIFNDMLLIVRKVLLRHNVSHSLLKNNRPTFSIFLEYPVSKGGINEIFWGSPNCWTLGAAGNEVFVPWSWISSKCFVQMQTIYKFSGRIFADFKTWQ